MYTDRNICTTRVPTSSHPSSKFADTKFPLIRQISAGFLIIFGLHISSCPYSLGSQGGGQWPTWQRLRYFLERAQQLDHYTEVLLKIINATTPIKKNKNSVGEALFSPRSDTLTASWTGSWSSTAATSLTKRKKIKKEMLTSVEKQVTCPPAHPPRPPWDEGGWPHPS